jgi:hypothetical protein
MNDDYKKMYEELKEALAIHQSHTHADTLAYIHQHNRKIRAAYGLWDAARVLQAKATDLFNG